MMAASRARWLARPAVSAGRDISWPQCPRGVGIPSVPGFGAPMPGPHVRFVVIGLTNGRGFTRNHCLDMHLRWAKRHHAWAGAYAMTTYPTRSQIGRHGHHGPYRHRRYRGRVGNAAFAAARFNIATMRHEHFRAPMVWLDIEPSGVRPWHSRAENRMVVLAWVRAYRAAGYRVGFYSTPYLWHGIVGDLRLGLPEWRTAGPAPARAALGQCRADQFQGGLGVIAQWWTSSRDFDRVCPGFRDGAAMRKYFVKY